MTIEQFAELAAKLLGYDDFSKMDERVILAVADVCRGLLLTDMLKNGDGLTGEYIKTFDQAILNDAGRGMSYVELPCSLCSIKEFGSFRFVGPPDEETAFFPIKAGTIASIQGMELEALGGRCGYLPEGGRVYFRFLPIPSPSVIRLKVVPSLLWLFDKEDDSDLMGTADLEQKVLDMTVDRLKIRRGTPVDNYNDNMEAP